MRCKAALLVVDVQRDFCPGGALPVPEGDKVVPVLNLYLQLFGNSGCPVFASRDWHPADSKHFTDNGGEWPVHCVQESAGAGFNPELALPARTIVVSKGVSRSENGYSAFEGVTGDGTPFPALLERMGVERLFIGGLATDYCVLASVLSAREAGLGVTVLTDAIRGVERTQGDSQRAVDEMVAAGAELATFEAVAATEIAEP